jgi:hypothetical protein
VKRNPDTLSLSSSSVFMFSRITEGVAGQLDLADLERRCVFLERNDLGGSGPGGAGGPRGRRWQRTG